MSAQREFVLGLVGRAGAGKDSVALALSRHGWGRIAFADALRAEVAAAWRIDSRMLTDRFVKEQPVQALSLGMCTDPDFITWALRAADYSPDEIHAPRSARWLLQRWGTDFRRSRDPDYWVKQALRKIKRQTASGRRHIVITDVRFANEAAALRGIGGSLVRVHRPEQPRLAADTALHASETEAELIECVDSIANDASIDALAEEAERVVYALFGPEALQSRSRCAPGAIE